MKHGTVVVLGHRGAPQRAPENTLESFQSAIQLGADGFEFDVRRSGDGRLVVVHNARIGARLVSRSSYERLQATRQGANMPLLEQVLSRFGSGWLDIELKAAGIEEPVLELARRFCTPGRYAITSFSRQVVSRLRSLDRTAPVGWLLKRPVNPGRWRGLQLNYLAPHYRALRADLVHAARQDGLGLIAWTVNSPRVLCRVLDLGVDVVCSDYPDRILSLMNPEQ